jgi:hypothetical protein
MMTAAPATDRIGHWLALLPLACGGLLATLGYWPTRSLAGQDGTAAMFAAVALVLTVVYATLLPAMRRMRRAAAGRRFQIALGAGVIRFLATLLVAGGLVWRGMAAPAAFLLWVALAYLVLINVETWALVAWCKRSDSQG